MIRIIKYLLPGLIWFASQSALAVLNVFACEPEWGALSQEIGGDKVKVFNATNALQDVHRIQARPSLIAAARNADIVVCSGLELEVGWLPVLVREGGNNKIQPGEPGSISRPENLSRVMEVPAFVDRSQGDVHPMVIRISIPMHATFSSLGTPSPSASPRSIMPTRRNIRRALSNSASAGARR